MAALTCRCLVILVLLSASLAWDEANPKVTSTVAPPCEKAGEVRDSKGLCRCGPEMGRVYSAMGSNSSYVCAACREGMVPVPVAGRSNLGDTACCHDNRMVAVRDESNMAVECHIRKDPAPVVVLNLPVYQPAPAQFDGVISPQEIIIIIVVSGLVLTIVIFLIRDIKRNSAGL